MSFVSPLILLVGKNGQVGWELQRCLMPIGRVVAFDRKDMNLSDIGLMRNIIQQLKPDVIINAAAYTAVDKAEQEVGLAMQINAVAPGILAEEAKKLNALMVHYSTDYVFDGTKKYLYTELDKPNPISVYGASKWKGEEAIQVVSGEYLILRTSWVYGLRGSNFLLTMLKLMKEREELSIVSDQVGAPTWSRLIAEVTAQVIAKAWLRKGQGQFESGLYHLTASGQASWFDFAESIADLARQCGDCLKVSHITPIKTVDYPTPAKRPLNSRLSLKLLKQQYHVNIPDWAEVLRLCMKNG